MYKQIMQYPLTFLIITDNTDRLHMWRLFSLTKERLSTQAYPQCIPAAYPFLRFLTRRLWLPRQKGYPRSRGSSTFWGRGLTIYSLFYNIFQTGARLTMSSWALGGLSLHTTTTTGHWKPVIKLPHQSRDLVLWFQSYSQHLSSRHNLGSYSKQNKFGSWPQAQYLRNCVYNGLIHISRFMSKINIKCQHRK